MNEFKENVTERLADENGCVTEKIDEGDDDF